MPTSRELLHSPELFPFASDLEDEMEQTLRQFVENVPWDGREDEDVEDIMGVLVDNKVKVMCNSVLCFGFLHASLCHAGGETLGARDPSGHFIPGWLPGWSEGIHESHLPQV